MRNCLTNRKNLFIEKETHVMLMLHVTLGTPTNLVHTAISLLTAGAPVEQKIVKFHCFLRHGVSNLLDTTRLPDFLKIVQCGKSVIVTWLELQMSCSHSVVCVSANWKQSGLDPCLWFHGFLWPNHGIRLCVTVSWRLHFQPGDGFACQQRNKMHANEMHASASNMLS